MIDGRHAVVSYDRVKTVTSQAMVVFYDEATGLVYTVRGGPKSRKNDPEATIDLARKFILPPAGPPPTTFRYDTYDTTGAVAEPGSYAFLEDPANTASVVTTYEGLRDGSATALRIHETDADGVSRAAFLDTVEVGNLFEWREGDDCFVRYRVTELLPDPSGTPRRLLGVEWMTYAFTGCSGAVSANALATVEWGELPDLGGTSLTVPVVHGMFQLAPEGWAGDVEEPEYHAPPRYSSATPGSTSDLFEAQLLPYWRTPTLPEGWAFAVASAGDPADPTYGYCALWAQARGYEGVEICGLYPTIRDYVEEAPLGGVYETRMIAGRPARVVFSPAGPNYNPYVSVVVWVYDGAAEALYVVRGLDGSLRGSNVDAVIAIARSLFESPNPQ